MSQTNLLYSLLLDGEWHDTMQILARVYGGSHLGLARVSARIYDIKKKPEVLDVESRKCENADTVWEYRMILKPTEPKEPPKPAEFSFTKNWVQ